MLNLTNILINAPVTLIALTGHELAHAWVSSKLGDPTPRYEGRLSINPLAHLDLVGTLLMIFTGFGWAKPVGVNPMYYKDRKKGMALVAIAGPVANLIMAFIGILVCALLSTFFIHSMNSPILWIYNAFYLFSFRNLCFMVFNLIPIPPLDGSKVLGIFVPNRTYYRVLEYERYSIILIMILSLSGAFDAIIGGGVGIFFRIIVNAVSAIIGLFV